MIQKTVCILLVFTSCAFHASAHSPCPPGEYSSYDDCFGKYQWDSGDIYVGDWETGKRTGQGTYTTSKGTRYVGTFKDNKYNGEGTYTFSNGDRYIGTFKDNKKHGQGTYLYAIGDKYVGEFENGKKNGQGTYTHKSGNKYIGGYKDNKRYGQGTFIYVNGAKEVGEWKGNILDGYAIKYNADGTIFREGIFKDDKFLREEKRSKSTKSASKTYKLDEHKEFCKEIGFTLGTEKFGDCVMKLMDRD